MKIFAPKLFSIKERFSKKQLINDIVAGVIVAIIALPLSIVGGCPLSDPAVL